MIVNGFKNVTYSKVNNKIKFNGNVANNLATNNINSTNRKTKSLLEIKILLASLLSISIGMVLGAKLKSYNMVNKEIKNFSQKYGELATNYLKNEIKGKKVIDKIKMIVDSDKFINDSPMFSEFYGENSKLKPIDFTKLFTEDGKYNLEMLTEYKKRNVLPDNFTENLEIQLRELGCFSSYRENQSLDFNKAIDDTAEKVFWCSPSGKLAQLFNFKSMPEISSQEVSFKYIDKAINSMLDKKLIAPEKFEKEGIILSKDKLAHMIIQEKFKPNLTLNS